MSPLVRLGEGKGEKGKGKKIKGKGMEKGNWIFKGHCMISSYSYERYIPALFFLTLLKKIITDLSVEQFKGIVSRDWKGMQMVSLDRFEV
jgi:hypothetical protein